MILFSSSIVLCVCVLVYFGTTGTPTHNWNIAYRKGIKYQLVETYCGQTELFPTERIFTSWITLDTTGTITIKRGYGWDGPSGPTYDTPDFMRAALVHDALYQLLRMKKLGNNDLERASFRNAADLEMRRISKEDGMNPIRRWATYMGVSVFAGYAADPANRRTVYQSPKEDS